MRPLSALPEPFSRRVLLRRAAAFPVLAAACAAPRAPAVVRSRETDITVADVRHGFEEYRYRDSMVPTRRFRMAYDLLKDRRTGRVVKDYLAILHLATQEGECRVDEALRLLLDQGRPPDAEAVTEALRQGQRPSAVTELSWTHCQICEREISAVAASSIRF